MDKVYDYQMWETETLRGSYVVEAVKSCDWCSLIL